MDVEVGYEWRYDQQYNGFAISSNFYRWLTCAGQPNAYSLFCREIGTSLQQGDALQDSGEAGVETCVPERYTGCAEQDTVHDHLRTVVRSQQTYI